MTIKRFQKQIEEFGAQHRRTFLWRETTDPYAIFVSEVMLQQTQTNRVTPYYQRFLKRFPTFSSLANASNAEVLQIWQGLGYNRRAIYLRNAAKIILEKFGGAIPSSVGELIKLPGIGPNTAGAIIAYAYNQPAVFIETNIRKAIIDAFFPRQETVSDQEVRVLVEKTLDQNDVREWYYALVDYGAKLGQQRLIRNNRSQHYVKQPPFEGSNRQIRAKMVRLLLIEPRSLTELTKQLGVSRETIAKNLAAFQKEGLVTQRRGLYHIDS